jgi:hypothetical protein
MFNPLDWTPYFDEWHLLTQDANSNHDGGDSAHRFATTYVALKSLDQHFWIDGYHELDDYYDFAMKYYESDTAGVFRRHPDPNKWYSKPNNFSRDQMTMIENAVVMAKDTGLASAIIDRMVERRGFHQNIMRNYDEPGQKTPDITTPSEIACLIRGSNNILLAPALLILDAFYLLDIVLAVYDDSLSTKKGGRTDAYTMLVTNLLVANQKFRTPFSWLAGKALGLVDYKGALNYIFRKEGGDPPIDKLLIAAAEKVL